MTAAVVCRILALLAVIAAAGAAACGRAPAPADNAVTGRLTLSGSSTIAPLAAEIGRRFEARHAGTRVDTQTGGSARGIADARRGTADIGLVSRALAEEEREDLTAHTIAIDGVSLIVHRDNPVPSLTSAQIVDVFTGRITNWRRLGGADAPITVVNKAEGRSTLDIFLTHFTLKSADVRPHVVIGDNQHGIRTVGADRHAIGYVSVGTADFEASRGAAIRMLPLDGVQPSLASVRDGSFPLVRPLNLVTTGTTSPLTRAFLDFALSAEVADLIEDQYFVPPAR